jgi:hypothetical protein
MSKKTEKALRDWREENSDVCDDLHHHFTDFDGWDWFDISSEARHVWEIMFDEKVETFSPIGGILSAVAGAAYEGTVAAVAAAIGVNARSLRIVLEPWTENKGNHPEKVTTDQLIEMCKEIDDSQPKGE